MSRTLRNFKGKKVRDKSSRKPNDKKFFGHTSGTHSRFEDQKQYIKKLFLDTPIDSIWYKLNKKRWEEIKDKTYPEKNKDFKKYGYGRF